MARVLGGGRAREVLPHVARAHIAQQVLEHRIQSAIARAAIATLGGATRPSWGSGVRGWVEEGGGGWGGSGRSHMNVRGRGSLRGVARKSPAARSLPSKRPFHFFTQQMTKVLLVAGLGVYVGAKPQLSQPVRATESSARSIFPQPLAYRCAPYYLWPVRASHHCMRQCRPPERPAQTCKALKLQPTPAIPSVA